MNTRTGEKNGSASTPITPSSTNDKDHPKPSSSMPTPSLTFDTLIARCTVKTCSGSNTDPLECYECDLKFHSACINMNDAIYQCIMQSACAGVRWHCSSCLSNPVSGSETSLQEFKISIQDEIKTISIGVENQLKLFKESFVKENKIYQDSNSDVKATITKVHEEFNKRFDSIEKQNLKFPEEVKDSISSYAKVVTNNIEENNETKKVVSSMKDTIKTMETNLTSKMEVDCSSLSAIEKGVEAKARASKANNIIVFNVPELDSEDAEECYKRDVAIIKTIFKDKVILEKEDIKSMFRIGLNKDATKSRPIIIKFTSIEKKTEVLKIKDLQYIDSNNLEHNIYMTHDRTKKEQEEHRKLVKKLKERRENGEENLVIRNGKIIQLQPFRPNPQLFWG